MEWDGLNGWPKRWETRPILREAVPYTRHMKQAWFCPISIAVPALLAAQVGPGPYARIAVLRPHDGQSVEFETGYVQHLEWHRQAGDSWTWYGWSIWGGDRYRWFVYATFGHSAASLDSAVTPAEDERDNLLNVAPHVEWVENGLYEYLPSLSRGSGVPPTTARLEFTSVELAPAAAKAFEAALGASRPGAEGETLWYRMVAGGAVPRYVRLRPMASLAALLTGSSEQALPDGARRLITRMTVEIWNLRPTMSLGLRTSSP
jgi:hypothetical protein